MQLTVGQIIESSAAMARLLVQEIEAPTAYLLARNAQALAAEYRTAQQQQEALMRRYGAAEAPGGRRELRLENPTAEFSAEWTALAAVEVEVAITPVALERLRRKPGEPAAITPADVIALEWMWAVEGAA